jgi:hypothetical protein
MRKTVRAIFNSPELLTANEIAKSEILKSLLKKHLPIAIEDERLKSFYRGTQESLDTGFRDMPCLVCR